MGLIRRSVPAKEFYMDEAAIITAKAAAVPVVVTSAYLITFVMLIGVGALLVIIRKLFLLSCPFLSENAKVVAGFIDVIVFLLDVIKGAVVGIIDVVDAVADVFGADIQPPRFVPIQFVNVNTLRRMLAEAPVVCARYDSVFDVVKGAFRLGVGQSLCETLRYLYPVPWLRDLTSATIGWASFDPEPLPDRSESNCAGDPDEVVFCMVLGAGYVLLEFLVPLMLAVVAAGLLWNLFRVLFNALIDTVEAARYEILKALGVVVRTEQKLTNKVEDLVLSRNNRAAPGLRPRPNIKT